MDSGEFIQEIQDIRGILIPGLDRECILRVAVTGLVREWK